MIGQPITTQIEALKKCLVCQSPATRWGNLPCAPGGKVYFCDTCASGLDATKRVFDAYRASHSKHITAFKQVNPNS